jgi:hypothetical protein
LKHFERQPFNQARRVDRDGDVCQCEEEYHDVVRENTVCADYAIVHFLSTDSEDGKQKEVCYQRCRYKIHRELQKYPRLGLAKMVNRIAMLRAISPRRYNSTLAQAIQESIRK